MIIQIRGTSGSGKTWIVNRLMRCYEFKPIVSKSKEIKGYYCKDLNLFIVGKYTVACGGCDTIKSQDEVCKRIHKAAKNGWNVLFEGLICSHIAARYAGLHKQYSEQGIPVRFIFLDTPLEECRKNINTRRAKKGKPPVMAKNTEKDYTSTHRSRVNMHTAGVPNKDMPLLSSGKAYKYIVQHLTEQEE